MEDAKQPWHLLTWEVANCPSPLRIVFFWPRTSICGLQTHFQLRGLIAEMAHANGSCCRENYSIAKEMLDLVAQGRVCGNLGNVYYLLGDFPQALLYHQQVRNQFFLTSLWLIQGSVPWGYRNFSWKWKGNQPTHLNSWLTRDLLV